MNGQKELDYYIKIGLKGLPWTNILANWEHLQAKKK
jgi:hypothetical protein